MKTISASGGLRIVIDFPWDASACMGTGAYSESMTRALAQAAPSWRITLIVPRGSPRPILLPNVTYASLPQTEGLHEGTRQVALPSYLHAVKADCLFAPASLLPASRPCAAVATVHDLTFETHPNHYAPGLVEYLARWFPVALASADRIAAISEPVKQDLLLRKRVAPDRVTVIEQPIRPSFCERAPDEEVESHLRAVKVGFPFFFHVSNLAPHKNTEFAVRVFAEYVRRHPESRHELLFAGGGYSPAAPPDVRGLANGLGLGDRVKYLGKLPDSLLKVLYQRCDAFLFPSLTEGWGLPVVEARALGAKVIASPHVPSASSEERTALVLGDWVRALEEIPERKAVSHPPPDPKRAGEKLGDTILEAIRAFRGLVAEPVKPVVRPAASSSGQSVAIRADWFSPSGFGQAARGVHQALSHAGIHAASVIVPKDAIQDRRLWSQEVSLALDRADLWIHHMPPDYLDLNLPGKHASFFFWETDRIPETVTGSNWPDLLSRLDEIWAPSTFVETVLKDSGVSAPIVRIPLPVDTALYRPGPRRTPLTLGVPPGFDPSWSVFLYVGTWDLRKRPDLLIRAFTRAFTEQDQALLVLKSYVTGDAARDRKILDEWILRSRESSGHVRALPEILAPDQMADLFRFATAFATATRGEGYCLPAVQAMSSGRPVIAPGWSAFEDYPVLPVDFELCPVPREVSLPGYSPDQRWGEIDVDDLSLKLRRIHERRDEARLLGKKGRDWVLENVAPAVVGKHLRDRTLALSGNLNPSLPLEVVQ